MTRFEICDFLELAENGATQHPPAVLINKLNDLKSRFQRAGGPPYIVGEKIVTNIDTMLSVLTPYTNHQESLTIDQAQKKEYGDAYNSMIQIFKEERQFKRLLGELEEIKKKTGKLTDYQDKLRQIIELAAKDEKFAVFLGRKGFLSTLEDHNSMHQEERSHRVLLGLEEYSDIQSKEEKLHNRWQEIIEYWYFYLLIQSRKYQDTQEVDKLLMNLKTEYDNAVKGFKEKAKIVDTELRDILSVTQPLNETHLLNYYAKQFDQESSDHKDQLKKWGWYLFAAIAGLVVIIVAAYVLEIPKDIRPSSGLLAGSIAIETLTLTVKVALVVAWLQLIKLIRRKYFALQHLHQIASHKAKTLKSMQGIIDNTDNKQMKERLLIAGAAEVFKSYETGYLSKKEGAGSTGVRDAKDLLQKSDYR